MLQRVLLSPEAADHKQAAMLSDLAMVDGYDCFLEKPDDVRHEII